MHLLKCTGREGLIKSNYDLKTVALNKVSSSYFFLVVDYERYRVLGFIDLSTYFRHPTVGLANCSEVQKHSTGGDL